MRPALLERIQAEARGLLEDGARRRVVVWGAGELGAWLMHELGARGVAFVDRNPTKRDTTIAGRPVHPVEALARLDFDEVWVTVLSDHAAVCAELEALGHAHRAVFPGGKRAQVLDQLPRTCEFLGRFDLAGRTLLEVGAGGQLFLALTLAHLGAERVLVSDVSAAGGVVEARRAEWLAYLAQLGAGDPPELLARIETVPRAVDAADLPFAAGSLDGIVNTGVMEHLSRPGQAIAEFARVLRPGGLALCLAVGIHDHRANDPASGFTPWSFLAYSEHEWRALGEDPYHQNRWRAVDFERAFRRAGFEVLADETRPDPRLDARQVAGFAPEFRLGYTRAELAELDLYLAALRTGA